MPVSKIDLDKCIGCGTCVESCPMDVFRLDTVVEYREEASPCSAACPLGLRQREYHDLLKMGMVDGAAAIMAECHPMPAITGRLCPHPCETGLQPGRRGCLRQYQRPRAVPGRSSADGGPPARRRGAGAAAERGRVAVIGSGPAGLSAAYFLARDGFSVTVFEKDAEVGGLLRTRGAGLPPARRPP